MPNLCDALHWIRYLSLLGKVKIYTIVIQRREREVTNRDLQHITILIAVRFGAPDFSNFASTR